MMICVYRTQQNLAAYVIERRETVEGAVEFVETMLETDGIAYEKAADDSGLPIVYKCEDGANYWISRNCP
jgi:hypothetical protein